MEIKFKSDINDFVAFSYHTLNDSIVFKVKYKLLHYVVPVLLMIYLTIKPPKNTTTLMVLLTLYLTISILWLIIFPKFYLWNIKKSLVSGLTNATGSNKEFDAEVRILLNENHITYLTPSSEKKFIWSSVTKVVVTNEYIFIFLTSISGIQIPFRGFNSSKEKDEFINYIYNHVDIQK